MHPHYMHHVVNLCCSNIIWIWQYNAPENITKFDEEATFLFFYHWD